jgi:hypothetical protein
MRPVPPIEPRQVSGNEAGIFAPKNEPEKIPWLLTPIKQRIQDPDKDGRPPIACPEERQQILTEVARNELERAELYPALSKPHVIVQAIDVLNKMDNLYKQELQPAGFSLSYNISVVSADAQAMLKRLLAGEGTGSQSAQSTQSPAITTNNNEIEAKLVD